MNQKVNQKLSTANARQWLSAQMIRPATRPAKPRMTAECAVTDPAAPVFPLGARSGGSERNSDPKTGFVGGLHVGSKLLEGLVPSGRGVDGTVHAALAVRGAATEEPDGGVGLGDLQRVHTNLARGSVEGYEARIEPILLGGGIKLPCARVGEATLGDGMVTTAELEVDDVTLLCSNLLRVEFETGCTILGSTNKDSDVGGRDKGRGDGGDGGDNSSGELHGAEREMNLERMKRIRRPINVDGTKD